MASSPQNVQDGTKQGLKSFPGDTSVALRPNIIGSIVRLRALGTLKAQNEDAGLNFER